ncbi:MAG: hypothetical protein ABW034_08975 [Steroidobacteraceae bacterium]
MSVIHDDRPHPVPPIAYLRYKENWFFLIMDEKSGVFGAIHVVSEPGFERIRFACHLSVKGELLKYGSEIAFPENFGFAEELGDGKFAVSFVKAHEQIDVRLHYEDVDMEISFLKRTPLFDFQEYDFANPDKVTVQEIVNFSTRQQYVHQQQGMLTRGTLSVKKGISAGKTIHVDGLGYRDHSRSVRCDNMTLKHFWTGLHFPNHVFGAMSVTGVLRPESPGNTGYVHDQSGGLRPLRLVDIRGKGDGPGGLPATVEFQLSDIYNQRFTISGDLSKRFAHVPLQTEKPGATPFVYDIVENFVPLTLKETGETGIGLIEVGWSTDRAGQRTQPAR